ncbi:hypothetical protein [Nitratifractor sp.]
MKKLLQQQTLQLEKQVEWLQHSLKQCQKLGIKSDYDADEYGLFETLSSRYSRTIDFLIRKYFRSIDAYEFESQGTLVDIVLRAHKRGLIDTVEELRLMKDLRNTVVHEYIEEKLSDTFEELLEYTPRLLEFSRRSLAYVQTLLKEEL